MKNSLRPERVFTFRSSLTAPPKIAAAFFLPAVLIIIMVIASCISANRVRPDPPIVFEGVASWYGDDFHGKKTSSGARYNMYLLTAASRTLPLGSKVEVTRVDNGRRVVVTINDRGPFVEGRIIDLSYEAARRLGMIEEGLGRVSLRILSYPAGTSIPPDTAGTSIPPDTAGTSILPDTPGDVGSLWISMGTFSHQSTAIWLTRQLTVNLPDVSMHSIDRGGRTLYQVRLGPFSGIEEAENAVGRIEKMGLKGVTVRDTVD